jgi:hypothetical protein
MNSNKTYYGDWIKLGDNRRFINGEQSPYNKKFMILRQKGSYFSTFLYAPVLLIEKTKGELHGMYWKNMHGQGLAYWRKYMGHSKPVAITENEAIETLNDPEYDKIVKE